MIVIPVGNTESLSRKSPQSAQADYELLLEFTRWSALVKGCRMSAVYQIAEAMEVGDTWVQVMQRYPLGVLCLLSALAFHELTAQSPPVMWLALPKSAWRKPEEYPPLRIVHFSGEAFTAGVETHHQQGGMVRVY